jgi:hypothetical protein
MIQTLSFLVKKMKYSQFVLDKTVFKQKKAVRYLTAFQTIIDSTILQ